MAKSWIYWAIPLVLTSAAFGADFWDSKPPAEWNEKDVAKLTTKSPWAKQVPMQFNADRMAQTGIPSGGRGGRGGGRGGWGGGGGGGMAGGGSMSGTAGMGAPGAGGGMGGPGGGGGGWGGGGGGGMAGGGMGGGGAMPEPPKVIVRWESAGPLRDSATQRELSPKFAEWSKTYYVVTTTGERRPEWNGRGAQGAGGAKPDPEQAKHWLEQLKTVTSLTPKGKSKITPERVEMVPGTDTMTTVFLFPRTPAIEESDKEVAFDTALGPMEIKAKFALKEMTYKGKLEL